MFTLEEIVDRSDFKSVVGTGGADRSLGSVPSEVLLTETISANRFCNFARLSASTIYTARSESMVYHGSNVRIIIPTRFVDESTV